MCRGVSGGKQYYDCDGEMQEGVCVCVCVCVYVCICV